MAAVQLSYRATEYDLMNKSQREVMLVGEAFLTNVGVGGGPVIPPVQPPVQPPIDLPPILPPIIPPPDDVKPPGSPSESIPGNWAVQPIVPPPYVTINYPGVGPVRVYPPAPPEK